MRGNEPGAQRTRENSVWRPSNFPNLDAEDRLGRRVGGDGVMAGHGGIVEAARSACLRTSFVDRSALTGCEVSYRAGRSSEANLLANLLLQLGIQLPVAGAQAEPMAARQTPDKESWTEIQV